MLTETDAQQFAHNWIAAWNSHNLDRIMSHYNLGVVLISPLAAKVMKDPSGTVEGYDALRNYFKRGLHASPTLAFRLLDVLVGVSSILVYFVNEAGTRTGEFMELGHDGKVVRVVATKANFAA